MTETTIHKTFGTILRTQSIIADTETDKFKIVYNKQSFTVPKSFDGREIWGDWLYPIKAQGLCGDCWSVATASVLSDRFTIQTKGIIHVPLSITHLTICRYESDINYKKLTTPQVQIAESEKGHDVGACNGISLADSCNFVYRYGLLSEKCVPSPLYDKFCNTIEVKRNRPCKPLQDYTSVDDIPSCEDLLGLDYDVCLDNITAARRFRAAAIYNLFDDNDDADEKELHMMRDICKYGPIMTGFNVFNDFLEEYDGKSIYTHPKKEQKSLGGHAVRIVGWGEGNQDKRLIKYWIIANSWGTDWGNKGFFRMERKLKECELEDNSLSMIPDIPYMSLKSVPTEQKWLNDQRNDQKRIEFGVDNITGYRYVTIKKIKQGKLIGDLTPLIRDNQVPNFTSFFAFKTKGKTKSWWSYKKITILLIILVVVYFVYRKHKRE